MTDIPETGEDWFKQAKLRLPEQGEVWFIYSPMKNPWGNIRIAAFTKAINPPHDELVVILNETDPKRIGVRIWKDIQISELWFKVRKIEVPSAADVMAASMEPLT